MKNKTKNRIEWFIAGVVVVAIILIIAVVYRIVDLVSQLEGVLR